MRRGPFPFLRDLAPVDGAPSCIRFDFLPAASGCRAAPSCRGFSPCVVSFQSWKGALWSLASDTLAGAGEAGACTSSFSRTAPPSTSSHARAREWKWTCGRALLCTVLLSVPQLGGQSPPRTHGKTEKWRNAFLLLSATPPWSTEHSDVRG